MNAPESSFEWGCSMSEIILFLSQIPNTLVEAKSNLINNKAILMGRKHQKHKLNWNVCFGSGGWVSMEHVCLRLCFCVCIFFSSVKGRTTFFFYANVILFREKILVLWLEPS